MKDIYYFIKWNFRGMESFSKRYFTYLTIGIILGFAIDPAFFMGTAFLMIADMVIDIFRMRYEEFKQEQQAMLDKLAEEKTNV